MLRFDGQVVLATVVQFVHHGASHVIVCGRTIAEWETTQRYTQAHLPREVGVVRIESQVQVMIHAIFSRYGRLDVCFNNTG